MPSIQYTIKNVTEALRSGVAKGIVRFSLKDQGYSSQRIGTIIRWAQAMNKAKMETYHLHRWSLGVDNDPYLAPEARRRYLLGYREQDTKRIQTSYITSVNGREIRTENSIYILEEIDEEYLQWLNENGLTYDANEPIKLRKL